MRFKIPWWPLFGLVLLLVGIGAYNYWAYRCGICAIRDMKTIGPQAKAVGYLIIGAAMTWFILFFRRLGRKQQHNCQCGRQTLTVWSYCPDCGCQIS